MSDGLPLESSSVPASSDPFRETRVPGPVRFPEPHIALASDPRRILIIKPSAIGDIVHALPVLNLLRRRWPHAHLTWLVTPACAGMVEGHPLIDQVIPFNRVGFSLVYRRIRMARELFRFAGELRRQRFDLVIDLQGLLRSGWVSALTRAPVRVGFANAREFGWMFYTHRVKSSWADHAVDRYLCIASALGLGTTPAEFPFAVSDADRAEAERTLRAESMLEANGFAVLVPGANWTSKRWPPAKFAALVEPLRQRFGLQSIVVGGPGDRDLARQIPGALDLTGKTNLPQLIALLGRAALVIGNDTGPMHIASALGRPMVMLYGPTDALCTGPYARLDTVVRVPKSCSPCFRRSSDRCQCIETIETEAVVSRAAEQLGKAEVAPASKG